MLGALLLASCPRKEVRQVPVGPVSATVFLSADVRGYLGPCGCSENMRGGVARAAFQVAAARKAGGPVLFIDAGDSLFGHLQLAEAAIPQEERKAHALAGAFKAMGLATHVVGELDEVRGRPFLDSLGLGDQAQGSLRLLELGSARVAVVASVAGEDLKARAEEARRGGAAFVIGVLHQPLEAAQRLGASPALGVDLLVAAHSQGEWGGEESRLVRAGVPVVQVQSKGRSLLRLDLSFAGKTGAGFELEKGQAEVERELAALDQRIELMRKQVNAPSLSPERLKLEKAKLEELFARREQLASAPLPAPADRNAFSARFIPLESSSPSAPEVQALVTAYDRDVGKINLAWAKEHGQDCPAPAKGTAAFVGNAACEDCHEEAFASWKGSKHSHAYATLEAVGKNFHLDCVKCHVTGSDKPGGVCRIDRVEGRKDVGCESCHGPGSLHVETPEKENIARGNTAQTCVTCHDLENSPHFVFQTYVAQILGPGHGQPSKGSAPPKKKDTPARSK